MINFVRFEYIFLIALFTGINASAQTGKISGKISCEGDGIEAATIKIAGTASGATTDSSSFYHIKNLKDGTYTLKVSALGYLPKTRTVILSGESMRADFTLEKFTSSLNEVVVTGVSKATQIKENPVAVSSVSPRAINNTIENNIIDVLVKNVPGLNAVKTGPNISKPFIRGLGYNRVLSLYDGMRQEGQQWGDEHGIEVDAYNINKAEVIKGPASLLFGSDALAGVVSLFPYMPTDSVLQGRIISEYQGNNGLIGNGFRIGQKNKNWLWILRGSYRQAKDYTNKNDGRVYNTGFKETNASATVGYHSAAGYTHLNATLYDNLQGIPDGSRDSLSRRFTKQIFEGVADDIKNRPLVTDRELDSYSLSPLHQHIQHYRLYANNHYRLGSGEVDATLGFQQNIRKEYTHPTQPTQAGLFVRLNTLNYGLKYIAVEFLNVELTAGINGMYQNNKSREATDFPIPDYNLLDAGGYVYARFKQQKWTLSGGLRYDVRRLQSADFYVGLDAETGFERQYFSPVNDTRLQFPALDKTFKGLSLSAGATYQITEKYSLKMNVARGYRSPSITEIASNGLDPGAHIVYLGNRNFEPEFSFQQDLGFFADLPDLTASFSIFNNTIQNYIYLSQQVDASGKPLVDAQGNRTFQYEQSGAHLYGAELYLAFHPVQFIKGFSFENTVSTVYGINTKGIFKNQGNNGRDLPLIPPLKWLGSAKQEIRTHSVLLSVFRFRVEVEYNAAQNRFLALSNTETATTSYTLLNAGFGFELNYHKTKNIEVELRANNVFDVAYQSNLSRLKYFEYYNSSPDGRSGIYGMGRNISLRVIVPF